MIEREREMPKFIPNSLNAFSLSIPLERVFRGKKAWFGVGSDLKGPLAVRASLGVDR